MLSTEALLTALAFTPHRAAMALRPNASQIEAVVILGGEECSMPKQYSRNSGKATFRRHNIQKIWNATMIAEMEVEEKERLTRKNDMGLAAAAIRLRAARAVTGMNQKDFSAACGVRNTVVSNAEAGSTHPSKEVMKYLYRAHRIDFNFMMNGDFAQLPGDVQERLFPALEAATIEWGQREGSGRTQGKPKRAQPER
ncbi:MAG: helix-turn-helix domain-containing protein [Cypionkella sp.]